MNQPIRPRGDSESELSRDIERAERLRQTITEESAKGTPDSALSGHIKELTELEKVIR